MRNRASFFYWYWNDFGVIDTCRYDLYTIEIILQYQQGVLVLGCLTLLMESLQYSCDQAIRTDLILHGTCDFVFAPGL